MENWGAAAIDRFASLRSIVQIGETLAQRTQNGHRAPTQRDHVRRAAVKRAGADVSADAALILAALGRIEAVVRDERAALGGLRTSLGDMAQAIARAKTVADSETAAAMLDEFEHRVDAMIEIAGGSAVRPSAAMPEPAEAIQRRLRNSQTPAAEPDQVPTVSGVVLRLGPGDEAAPQAAAEEPAPPAETCRPTRARPSRC